MPPGASDKCFNLKSDLNHFLSCAYVFVIWRFCQHNLTLDVKPEETSTGEFMLLQWDA